MSSPATARRSYCCTAFPNSVCLASSNPGARRALHGHRPDLRGYGYTEKPYDGSDKRKMAADIRELMATLGCDRAAVAGHDRGAQVGLRPAKDHRDFVERLAVLDNAGTRPTRGVPTR